ncbi:DMT family transporter [Marivita sp.]|uniref:DMT family transporter n=1 Tax=Marivita sp. TaxID=2003365 RepID=UPI0025C0314A|nr:DMT family transporter [Marivita sp.]
MTSDSKPFFGLLLMLIGAGLGAVDAALVRYVSPSVHPFVIGFTRALFGLLVFLPFILARPAILRSAFGPRHALRATLKLASLIAFFIAFASAPLADVMAIGFAAPIGVTIGSWLFLSERPRALRILGVIVGFVGVLIVLRPGQGGDMSAGLLFALLGAVLTAVIQLVLKPMSRRDSTETLVAWNLIWTVPIAAIPAALVWEMPSVTEWGLLAIQGALGMVAMGAITRAFSYADASLVAPVDFMRLPFAAVLGFALFAQEVPLTTWVGGAVIFASTLITARSARARMPEEL